MNMNQVAIAYSDEAERERIKIILGLQDAVWVRDTVTSKVKVLNRNGQHIEGVNTAELEFCMAMGGQQFEMIRYVDGPNWLSVAARMGARTPFCAHVGFHLDDGEDWPPVTGMATLVQEAFTVEHSNAELNAAGRRYHYRIYRVGGQTFFKFIKRLHVTAAMLPPVMETDVMVDSNVNEPKVQEG